MEKNSNKKDLNLVYKLDQLLQNKNIEQEQLIELGKDITQNLSSATYEPSLFDKILKNYMTLLTSFYPEYKETFKKFGYQIINEYIEKDLKITLNMILFDCHMIKDKLHLQKPESIEFYSDLDSEECAYMDNDVLKIDESKINQLYEMYDNKKIPIQQYFFNIGHELEHFYIEEHKSDLFELKNEQDPEIALKKALKILNIKCSIALQHATSEKFYFSNHASFVHEHDANIVGIQLLYDRYNYLPSIKNKDKIQFNQTLSLILCDAYTHKVDDKIHIQSPVDFTRQYLDLEKDNLLNYEAILLSKLEKGLSAAKLIEEDLTDEEKLIFGYDTPYFKIVQLIGVGILPSINLFEEIPKYYEAMQEAKIIK